MLKVHLVQSKVNQMNIAPSVQALSIYFIDCYFKANHKNDNVQYQHLYSSFLCILTNTHKHYKTE